MGIPVFSQLHIKPYGSQDSFVYVENGFLFVEKQIDLSINPSEAKKASLYLREEAQFLQGTSNATNTGNGMLSVFQERNASAYTYNYWSAPVQDVSGSSIFGTTLYEPIDELKRKKALITSDLNGHSNPLKISDRWIYKFTGGTYSEWIYSGKNFDLLPGEGFTMKGVDGTNTEVKIYGILNNPGNKQRYDFRGKPYSGSISLIIEKDKNRLVGNPFKLSSSNSPEISMLRFKVEFNKKYISQLLLIHRPDATNEIDHAMDA